MLKNLTPISHLGFLTAYTTFSDCTRNIDLIRDIVVAVELLAVMFKMYPVKPTFRNRKTEDLTFFLLGPILSTGLAHRAQFFRLGLFSPPLPFNRFLDTKHHVRSHDYSEATTKTITAQLAIAIEITLGLT